METRDQSFRSVGSYKDLTICSKPTAWDGDPHLRVSNKILCIVLSPPRGMEIASGGRGSSEKKHHARSKPTVWDGDLIRAVIASGSLRFAF